MYKVLQVSLQAASCAEPRLKHDISIRGALMMPPGINVKVDLQCAQMCGWWQMQKLYCVPHSDQEPHPIFCACRCPQACCQPWSWTGGVRGERRDHEAAGGGVPGQRAPDARCGQQGARAGRCSHAPGAPPVLGLAVLVVPVLVSAGSAQPCRLFACPWCLNYIFALCQLQDRHYRPNVFPLHRT